MRKFISMSVLISMLALSGCKTIANKSQGSGLSAAGHGSYEFSKISISTLDRDGKPIPDVEFTYSVEANYYGWVPKELRGHDMPYRGEFFFGGPIKRLMVSGPDGKAEISPLKITEEDAEISGGIFPPEVRELIYLHIHQSEGLCGDRVETFDIGPMSVTPKHPNGDDDLCEFSIALNGKDPREIFKGREGSRRLPSSIVAVCRSKLTTAEIKKQRSSCKKF